MDDLAQLLMQQQSQGKLNRKADLAQMLLQNGQKTTNPLVAALSGFVGTHELSNIADKQGELDTAKMRYEIEQQQQEKETEAQRYERQMGLREQQFAESQRQFNEQMKQNSQQFAANISLQREKFNAAAIRDAQNNAITKIQDPKTGNDLLFKGVEPVTQGLDKGMQWAIDKEGKRLAVPIPTQPSEKALAQKQLTLELVNRLLQNKDGVKSVYGAVDRLTPNLLTSTRNAETDINALRAITTLENLSLLKGSMSDNDIKFIQNASTGALNQETASQEGALAALEAMKFALEGRSFATEAEAEASGLRGKVLIGGRPAEID